MRRVNVAALATTFALGALAVFAAPARAQTGVTAFEGARLIVGDGGAPIENATLLVDGARIVAAGRAADVNVPSGATRVSLAGKTVLPMLIDTHVHLSPTREAIMRDLRQRAYFGVSAALSLGMDNYELLDIRGQTVPGSARFFSAGRGITMPEPGRLTVPYWINTEAEGRKAVQELAGHSETRAATCAAQVVQASGLGAGGLAVAGSRGKPCVSMRWLGAVANSCCPSLWPARQY
jgi:hypothetical protein